MQHAKILINELTAILPREIRTLSLCLLRHGIPQSLRVIMINMIFRSSKLPLVRKFSQFGNEEINWLSPKYAVMDVYERPHNMTHEMIHEFITNRYGISFPYRSFDSITGFIISGLHIFPTRDHIKVYICPELLPHVQYDNKYYSNQKYPLLKELIESEDEKMTDKYIRHTDSVLKYYDGSDDRFIEESLSGLFR